MDLSMRLLRLLVKEGRKNCIDKLKSQVMQKVLLNEIDYELVLYIFICKLTNRYFRRTDFPVMGTGIDQLITDNDRLDQAKLFNLIDYTKMLTNICLDTILSSFSCINWRPPVLLSTRCDKINLYHPGS